MLVLLRDAAELGDSFTAVQGVIVIACKVY